MQKGSINVQSENIFPIIKKFLYSDTEIFLRELVSNAVDASQKLMTLSSAGEVKQEVGELKVEVILDKKKKTLTIRDHGIGMTQDEVNKYINEVAFSGVASIALPKFVINGKFDHEKLFKVAYRVTKNLDKVIDANYYPVAS